MTKSSLHAQFMAAVIAGRYANGRFSNVTLDSTGRTTGLRTPTMEGLALGVVDSTDKLLDAFLARWPDLKLED